MTRRALANDIFKTRLDIVSDGEQALDYLYCRGLYANKPKAALPDLVLLDLNMPKMDGREVLRRIKSDDWLRKLPVIILTTSQQEADIVRSYDLGCNSFISKPVDVSTFISVIRDLGLYWFELVTLPDK